MVLLITNKQDITVDFIVRELKAQKCPYYRLNTEDIPTIVHVQFDVDNGNYILYDTIKQESLSLSDISSVYFRRPEIATLENIPKLDSYERNYLRLELATLLEGIYKSLRNVYWINDVYKIREAENKLYQLQIAQEIGFKIPRTVIANEHKLLKQTMEAFQGDCIIKPIRSGNMGYADGRKVIFTSMVDPENFTPERITAFPVYLQENIHKTCDTRCIVVGSRVFAASIDSQRSEDGKVDWRKAHEYLPHYKIDLPDEIQRKAIALTQRLELTYSAIDLVLSTNREYIFLECNPNGQWAWIENRLGYPISKRIVSLLREVSE